MQSRKELAALVIGDKVEELLICHRRLDSSESQAEDELAAVGAHATARVVISSVTKDFAINLKTTP
jgi:hypothetical protein